MSKIKNWMMEMQDEADFALREGAENAGQVILAIRQAGIHNVDERWVREYVEERLGDKHE